mmetsp:Transcript_18796/g.47249  ORF Transcript_18796/g.47249 Transcript_18796/m.47249 type:complete len:100 (+) Transcript_18796:395-694(+)
MITATGERLGFSGIKVALTGDGYLQLCIGSILALQRRPRQQSGAAAARHHVARGHLRPDGAAAQGQQRMAQPCRCSRMCGSTDNTETDARSQTAVADFG